MQPHSKQLTLHVQVQVQQAKKYIRHSTKANAASRGETGWQHQQQLDRPEPLKTIGSGHWRLNWYRSPQDSASRAMPNAGDGKASKKGLQWTGEGPKGGEKWA